MLSERAWSYFSSGTFFWRMELWKDSVADQMELTELISFARFYSMGDNL